LKARRVGPARRQNGACQLEEALVSEHQLYFAEVAEQTQSILSGGRFDEGDGRKSSDGLTRISHDRKENSAREPACLDAIFAFRRSVELPPSLAWNRGFLSCKTDSSGNDAGRWQKFRRDW
jgi:hypothetical protein